MSDAAERPDRFEGPREFQAAVLESWRAALEAGVASLTVVDTDFADWPLDDPDLLDALTAWARAGRGRHLQLLARDFDAVPRRHPRFTQWRRLFAHVVECRAAPSVDASDFPTLLLHAGGGLQAVGSPSRRGHRLRDVAERRTWTEVVDAISQRSESAFPAHPLGL